LVDFFGAGRFAALGFLRLTALGATLRDFGAAFLIFFFGLAIGRTSWLRDRDRIFS